jgi:hypothetical protein
MQRMQRRMQRINDLRRLLATAGLPDGKNTLQGTCWRQMLDAGATPSPTGSGDLQIVCHWLGLRSRCTRVLPRYTRLCASAGERVCVAAAAETRRSGPMPGTMRLDKRRSAGGSGHSQHQSSPSPPPQPYAMVHD